MNFIPNTLEKKVYFTLEKIQTDLDAFLEKYKAKRTNQGKHCKSRIPLETFKDSLDLCWQNLHDGQNMIQEAA